MYMYMYMYMYITPPGDGGRRCSEYHRGQFSRVGLGSAPCDGCPFVPKLPTGSHCYHDHHCR